MRARRRDFFSQLLFAAFAVRFEVQGSFEVCSERQQISASLFVIIIRGCAKRIVGRSGISRLIMET